MLLNTDYLVPSVLTGYVRAAEADWAINQFSLNRFLPDRTIDDLVYRFVRNGEGLTEAATYRAYDAEAPIAGRPGATRVTGELPPISRKMRLGEYDRIKQRNMDSQATEIESYLLSDGVRLARAIGARIELARGDALVNGSVTISENGVTASVSFGRTSAHSVAAATLWSDPSSTPIEDLFAWQDTYLTTNGVLPGAMVTSRKVLNTLLRSPEMRALAATVVGTPSMVSVTELQSILEAHGLPSITTYDARVNVSGTATRVIADDKVLLLPEATSSPDGTQLGATMWGTTVEATDPRFGLSASGDGPGIAAGVYSEEDPISLWTKASAIALPVLANPNLSFVADVL